MREIKFRGQRVDNKEWVYGGIFIPNSNSGKAVIYTYDPIDKYSVYSETVGQYTGLKDKNGTEIYEGDIVHIILWDREGKPIIEEKAIVVFEHGKFGVHRGRESHLSSFDAFFNTTFEVIGNIHDNPELMEGAK